MTKLCRDCRHSAVQYAVRMLGAWAYGRIGEEMLCLHDMSGTRSVVTGERTYETCAAMREYARPCGTTGKLWEAPDDAQDS